jgi:DNA invertase Pin-like site-specific DNA recombinase
VNVLAAVYARKSTDQLGLTDEQKSVTRQVEHARVYAERKGWTVTDEFVFMDDAVSGAEFATRPGFVGLMATLKPRPRFQVLVMAEESRLGREQIEVAYALKQLAQAGVRVWLYLEDRERTLDSPTDKLLMSVTAFADELEREKARQRTYDALARKARAGHVTGGVVFGYRNREVVAGDGHRQYVEREIDPGEAAVVRRIFELCAAGVGVRRTAIRLNDEGTLAPTPRRAGRPRSWAPSSVREVLYRDLYRGVVVWNRIRKRDVWGLKRYLARPEDQWMRREAPELRIVDDTLWTAAHRRLEESRQLSLGHERQAERSRPGGEGDRIEVPADRLRPVRDLRRQSDGTLPGLRLAAEVHLSLRLSPSARPNRLRQRARSADGQHRPRRAHLDRARSSPQRSRRACDRIRH